MNVGKPELSVQVDRPKAADLGVQVADAAEALRLLVGGDQVTTYNEGSEQYEVHLRAQAEHRSTQAGDRRADGAFSSALGSVPLENIAHFTPSSAPADINRLSPAAAGDDVRRPAAQCLTVGSAGTPSRPSSTRLKPGPDYVGGFSGRSRELGRAAQNFVLAFALSLVFMYLILAAQFESWLHPITILLSLPLTIPFALLAILIFHQSLNIFTVLGMLVLFGVVKKNSILQIDHANHLKEQAGLDDARRSSRRAATVCVRS